MSKYMVDYECLDLMYSKFMTPYYRALPLITVAQNRLQAVIGQPTTILLQKHPGLRALLKARHLITVVASHTHKPPYKRIRRLTPTPAKKAAPPPRRNAAWLAIRHSHSPWSLRATLVVNLVSPNTVHRIQQAAASLVPPPHALSQWRSWGCTPHSRSSTLPQLTQFNPRDPRPQTPAPSLPSPASA